MHELIYIVCPQCDITNRVPRARLDENPKCGRCKQSLFNAHPIELTKANFKKHLVNSSIPVVIDFWAPWCGPCRMMSPIFEQASAQLEPKVRLAKLNTEQEQMIAAQFGIQSIPTTVIFVGGKEVARQSAAVDLSSLIRWVQSHI